MRAVRFIFLGLVVASSLFSARAADPLAARVIILANSADPDSVRIAQHYAEVREVPAANIIALAMPTTETITWTEFVGTIFGPLQSELIRRTWIDAIPMELTDEVGRRKSAMAGHRISFLVVCRGVPLRIGHDPNRYHPHPPLTDSPFFQTNGAAVDSELSLLAVSDSPINAFLVNPLFRNDHPGAAAIASVVKVSRLDGPTAADASALVDHAIAAERTGLIGRAYVDVGGFHPDGDAWLKTSAVQARELGFDTDVDEARATFPATARFDAPALYFGWYTKQLDGPFALPGFQFPPGAIAIHIHSDSATTLRSSEQGWTGPLVARGVTATVGNVFEPYLQLLHRPDLMLRALARGDRFGDAAYYALPALSWQAIAIGDPLYRPFAVSLSAQWKNRAQLDARMSGYVALREMHRLESAKRPAEALTLIEAEQKQRPSLALAFEIARRREGVGDTKGAGIALAFAATIKQFAPDDWGLAHEAAKSLQRAGQYAAVELVYRHLLRDSHVPSELREPWVREAREAAIAAGHLDEAAAWSK